MEPEESIREWLNSSKLTVLNPDPIVPFHCLQPLEEHTRAQGVPLSILQLGLLCAAMHDPVNQLLRPLCWLIAL
jgi:hypothetical protein